MKLKPIQQRKSDPHQHNEKYNTLGHHAAPPQYETVQCTCKFKQIRIMSDTTVRHCWDKLPSLYREILQRQQERSPLEGMGDENYSGMLRVNLGTGSVFSLECLSFCWRGILQINLQALQINFLLGFIALFFQTDPLRLSFFFRHILKF